MVNRLKCLDFQAKLIHESCPLNFILFWVILLPYPYSWKIPFSKRFILSVQVEEMDLNGGRK